MDQEGIAIPAPGDTPGYYLIEALEYWGAVSPDGRALGPQECAAIAQIEGLGHDDTKELRALSLAFLEGYRRGEEPLGIPPRYEDYGHD